MGLDRVHDRFAHARSGRHDSKREPRPWLRIETAGCHHVHRVDPLFRESNPSQRVHQSDIRQLDALSSTLDLIAFEYRDVQYLP